MHALSLGSVPIWKCPCYNIVATGCTVIALQNAESGFYSKTVQLCGLNFQLWYYDFRYLLAFCLPLRAVYTMEIMQIKFSSHSKHSHRCHINHNANSICFWSIHFHKWFEAGCYCNPLTHHIKLCMCEHAKITTATYSYACRLLPLDSPLFALRVYNRPCALLI